MAAKRSKISLRDALQGDLPEKGEDELWVGFKRVVQGAEGS